MCCLLVSLPYCISLKDDLIGPNLMSKFLQALESEQCVDVGGKLSALSFKTDIHDIPTDFWSEGVGQSKGILETILVRIKSYEKSADIKWIDALREKFVNGNGNAFLDLDEGMKNVLVDIVLIITDSRRDLA